MKKFKFGKPFSSFAMISKRKNASLKENWRVALHDPAYLFVLLFILIILAFVIIGLFK